MNIPTQNANLPMKEDADTFPRSWAVPSQYPGLPRDLPTDSPHTETVTGQNLISVLNLPDSYAQEYAHSEPYVIQPLDENSLLHKPRSSLVLENYSRFSYNSFTKRVAAKRSLAKLYLDIPAEETHVSVCEEVIPEEFFSREFHPSKSAFIRESFEKKNLVLMHEKMAYYLDVIEMSLMKEITIRSDVFFAEFLRIQQLHAEIAKIQTQLSLIKASEHRYHSALALFPLKAVKIHRRRANLQRVKTNIETVKTIHSSLRTIKSLISTSDYSYAIDIIESTKALFQKDFRDIQCLRNTMIKFSEMEILVLKMICEELSELVESLESLNDLSESEYRAQLTHMCQCLHRIGQLPYVFEPVSLFHQTKLRQAVVSEIRSLAAESVEGADDSSLSAVIRTSSASEFPAIVSGVCDAVDRVLECVVRDERIIRSCVDDILAKGSYGNIHLKFKEFLRSVCECAASRLCFVLDALAVEDSEDDGVLLAARLRLPELKVVVDRVNVVISSMERLSSDTFYGLRGSLLSVSKAFLKQLYEDSVTTLNTSLETEDWALAVVPWAMQRLVDRGLLLSTNRDGKVLFRRHSSAVDQLTELRSAWWDDLESTKAAERLVGEEFLVVSDEKHHVVKSLFVLLTLMSQHILCAVEIESVATEALHRLIQLITVYNSRTCQLILGGGVVHLSLKKITAKHLALAAQSITCVRHVIPVVERSLRRKLSEKHHRVLTEFRRVESDLLNHQKEIFRKLVSIMKDLVQLACRKFLNKSQRPLLGKPLPGEKGSVRDPDVLLLVKQLRALHRVLTTLLAPREREDVFARVEDAFESVFLEHLVTVEKNMQDPSFTGEQVTSVKSYIAVHLSHVLQELEALKISHGALYKTFSSWI